MPKLTKQQKEEIIKKIQEDKSISDEYRFLIPFETEREYELTYADKERKEDILADTLSVPFQPIKKFGEVKEGEWHNMLIFGENLQALKHLLKLKEQGKLRNPDGTNGVKLVYIDPPFGTGDIYDAKEEIPAYSAKLQGVKFLEHLRKRLIFLKELLTDDGSIYVRIDYHFGHYTKVIMDEVFDKNNFINEIIINRSARPTEPKGMYHTTHDVLLFYSRSQNYFFKNFEIKRQERKWRGMHLPGVRWTKIDGTYLEFFKKDIREKNGEYYSRARIFFGKEILPPEGRHWAINQENIFKLEKEGKIKMDEKGRPINFESETQKVGDNWTDIPGYTRYWNYPTENSEELLERVIQGSSHINDIILDCFAGSGTTGAVAEKLGRKWIMCDIGKLAVYTMQKRMLNSKTEIGNKGKALKPKPFVLYNAGLYLDSGFIEKMDEVDYRKFVLELFNAEPSEHKIKGVEFHGILNNRPVMVFSQKDYLTHEFIDDLHKTVGSGLKDEMYIIAPMSVVRFNEDYVDKRKIRYHILKVPYSIIQTILEKDFKRGLQPLSKDKINQIIESVGFDFIYPPKVECEYYQSNEGELFDQLVIKIKKFEPVQISKKLVEFKDPRKEALSMVMIDKDYDGKVFDMDYYFFNDEIVKDDFKVIFPVEKAGPKIMIIYLDVLGNEKVEVKDIKDFKKK